VNKQVPRWVLAAYPRAWRDRYGEEVGDLFEELVASGESTPSRLVVGLLAHAVAERLHSFHRSRRAVLAVCVVAAVAVSGATFMAAWGSGSSRPTVAMPTKGRIPKSLDVTNGSVDLKEIPDFIAVVKNNKVVGYVPSRDLFGGRPGAPAPTNPIQPVYAANLKTLVGHMYPGVGFVGLGKSPDDVPCVNETTTGGTIPCPAVLVAIPDVVGMYTPTAAAAISQVGFDLRFVYVHSNLVPGGDIVAMAPTPGAKVHARSVITLTSSIGP
jgi:hypothetical protein